MSKKDYVAIAQIIASKRPAAISATDDALDSIVNGLCDLFSRDNKRFDTQRFKEACR